LHHRIDNFEVGRIERQIQVNRAVVGRNVRRETHVVFHVARRQIGRSAAFEFAKEIARQFAQNVHEHIEPPAVRHADHQLLQAGCRGCMHQIINPGNHRVAPFEREALLADVFLVQVLFQGFSSRDLLKDAFLLRQREIRLRAATFKPILHPLTQLVIGQMGVFQPGMAAVSFLEEIHHFSHRSLGHIGDIGAIAHSHIGIVKAVGFGIEFRQISVIHALQRIEFGLTAAQNPVGRDHAQQIHLLARGLGRGGGITLFHARLLGQLSEGFFNWRAWNIASCKTRGLLQAIKIGFPLRRNRTWIA